MKFSRRSLFVGLFSLPVLTVPVLASVTDESTKTYLQREIEKILSKQVFEVNDELTREQVTRNIEKVCTIAKRWNKNLEDYAIQCDESNNGTELIDNNEFVVDVYYKFIDHPFETLTGSVTTTGVSFDSLQMYEFKK